ncbi:7-cyano-7-deazaguanine synthase QueC [Archaeoglobus veneficus]|uniref:7-cyano-7-deazaguanine synthase n=1 Tax=Archaeoglobus veneficus (strain DSM 11195 / SNP6) TaxID=693661 RepID=F2KSR9_ARCVS|nr:7-cyano-7-deazaguanine synthase QueC [Archaeoglobus veneficus]AEA46964.1 exsB protein [Archaeoglobus veneficus SNP6]
MKFVAVLSGGMDSGVAMAKALQEGSIELALTFDYGQMAAKKEIEYAGKLCKYYGVAHKVIELPWLANLSSGLTEGRIPEVSEEILEAVAEETAKAVWVPNRNMVFISIAAAFAESMGCNAVVVGFNGEEAQTFPDNSEEFVKAMNDALRIVNGVSVYAPLIKLDKTEIVKLGMSMNFPFELTWSCYYSYDEPCGKCESCVRRQRAFRALQK